MAWGRGVLLLRTPHPSLMPLARWDRTGLPPGWVPEELSTAKWVPYKVPLTTGHPQGRLAGPHFPSSPGGSCSCSAGGVVETAQLPEEQQKMHVSAPNPFPEDSLDGSCERTCLPVNGRGKDRGLSEKQAFSQGLSQRLLAFAPDFSQPRKSFLSFQGRGFF